jgi:2-amino-4-hydroxy-6-hydroxymethyldihydropteridine diphosphokinase
MTVAYLALGANLGDRRTAIERALEALADLDADLGVGVGVRVAARSPLYETDAVTPDPQPRYLNAAARVETALPPRALLDRCLDVERALGRIRPPGRTAAARVIDIDLLLYGDAVIDEAPDLIVPHPRLLERPFVHPITRAPLDRAAPDASVRAMPDPRC